MLVEGRRRRFRAGGSELGRRFADLLDLGIDLRQPVLGHDLLVDELGIDRDAIAQDAKFEEDLDVDSLGVVELLMALEDNFGVKIPDEEAEQITTVGEAVDLVEKKLAS